MEHPKSKTTQPRFATRRDTQYLNEFSYTYVFAAVFTTEDPCPTDNCSKYQLNIFINLIRWASWKLIRLLRLLSNGLLSNGLLYDGLQITRFIVIFVYLIDSIFYIKCMDNVCINRSVKSHAISRFE